MSHPARDYTGARIAEMRVRRGLTQSGLAMRASFSKSLLSKVECGQRPASPALVAACARALGVDAAKLTGPAGNGRIDLTAIRSVLDLYDLPPDDSVRPRPLPELRVAVRNCNKLAQAADYGPMVAALPGLLVELHTAAHSFTGRARVAVWGLLAEAYRCGHSVSIHSTPELSATALSRMDWAASRAGARAPGLRAAREYLRVTAYLRNGDYAACWRLNASGARRLAGAEHGDPGVAVARGQLALGAAVIAARTGDEDTAKGYLEEAARHARGTGEDVETFWFGFGPTNVAVHRVMVLVELGKYAEAAKQAQHVHFPRSWLPTRISHHHFDLARAYQWMDRPDAALAELQRARQVAPQQVRGHPSVRETVGALVRDGRRPTRELREYARWVGI